jgi:two-component system response regulator HydG
MIQGDLGKLWEKVKESMMEGVVILDPKGVILSVNRAMEEITGYTQHELVGQNCGLIRCETCFSAHPDQPPKQCELFQKGAIPSSKCVLVKKDGSLRHVMKNAALITDDADQVLGGVEILMDMDEVMAQEKLITRLRRELSQEDGFQGILGKSAVMLQLFSLISSVAQSDAPVIIVGESGTGKELVAQAIHRLSPRKQGPYIRVNCKSMQESLLESELFGLGKEAGSGAGPGRPGYFEAAQGGDLFLDEVGDLPLTTQAKLLRVLGEKVIEREEGQKPIPVEVRLITATNQNLHQCMAEGRFRKALFYRLNVISIHLPPLRERREDIPLLAGAFFERARLKTLKPIKGFSKEALELLTVYDWPGNVRELINAVDYAFMLCSEGNILPEHLPAQLIQGGGLRLRTSKSRAGSRARDKESLVRALKEAGGKMNEAARILGVSRVTLWKWLKYHKIKVEEVVL